MLHTQNDCNVICQCYIYFNKETDKIGTKNLVKIVKNYGTKIWEKIETQRGK